MILETLGLTESQITILQKKGITSVEAFLRKQPLHYYDFTETLPLLEHDKRVTDKLAANKAFAIIGTCTSYNVELKNHMQMVKLRVTEELSGNTLFVNYMPAEALKLMLLEQTDSHVVTRNLKLPSQTTFNGAAQPDIIHTSCYKQIKKMNEAHTVTADMFSKLKTGGIDGVSKMSLSELEKSIPEDMILYVSNRFTDNTRLSCLRWIMRGLRMDLAIRKTYYDNLSLSSMLLNKRLIIGGYIRYSQDYGTWSVLNPPVIYTDIGRYQKINVQYSQMKEFTSAEYEKFVDKAIRAISDFEIMPEYILNKYNLLSLRAASMCMHHPISAMDIKNAKKRAIFDDLLYLAIKMELNAPDASRHISPKMEKTDVMEHYIASLPYKLTNGQRSAIPRGLSCRWCWECCVPC